MISRSSSLTGFERVVYGLLLAVVLAAPFEPLQPSFSLPGQELTRVELVLFGALAVWVGFLLVSRRIPQFRTPLSLPVVFLLGALILSTLLAAEDPALSVRSVGRIAIGFCLYLMVVDVVSSRRRLRGVLCAATIIGVIVSVIGVLEFLQLPSVLEWLKDYRPGMSRVAGQVRVSSTLQYPTIASMYLEAMFGLAMALLIHFVRTQSRLIWVQLGAVLVIGGGVLLTLSRSGFISLCAILLFFAVRLVGRTGFDRAFRVVALVGLCLLAELGLILLDEPNLSLRFSTESHRSWYRAEFAAPPALQLRPGEVREVEITVVNRGRAAWSPDDENPFRLSYHWLSVDASEILEYEGLRTELPRVVQPGESITVDVQVRGPSREGQYQLAWDILQEERFWFSDENPSRTTFTQVAVAADSSLPVGQTTAHVGKAGKRLGAIDRKALWSAAVRMWLESPLLGVGPGNFRNLYGPYAGLEDWDRRHHTNNLYLEFLVGGGVLAAAGLGWLVLNLVRLVVRVKRSPEALMPVHLGIGASVLAILVHGCFDYFLEFTPTYTVIWIVFGLAVAGVRLESRSGVDGWCFEMRGWRF